MYSGRSEKIVATIEARMASSRLPGKVLKPLAGEPSLWHLIRRLKRSQYLDVIVLATTTNAIDDVLAGFAQESGISLFRGSDADVLARVLAAARSVSGDIIVEITGDCPLIDPAIVDRAIEEFCTHDTDYVSNMLNNETYPGGFDVQVYRTRTLAEVSELTNDPIDRAHVSYYIYQHPEKYRLHSFEALPGEYGPQFRATLDEVADYKVLSEVFAALYPLNPNFSCADVVSFLQAHPDVAALNKNVRQKEPHEL